MLVATIRQIERENDGNYGVQKVYEELREERNISIGRSKVQRLMHENGIRAQIKSKYKPQTTKADPTAKAFPNLLNQNFDVTEVNNSTFAAGNWEISLDVIGQGRHPVV